MLTHIVIIWITITDRQDLYNYKKNIEFENIEYLKTGNIKQKAAYKVLTENQILLKLNKFDPILAGTIPINIDIEDSDLDIICYCKDKNDFKKIILENFNDLINFKIWEQDKFESKAVIASFKIDKFEIEIFGQNIPTKEQNAYRHMIIENRLLEERGKPFREKIIELKRKGYKTESAFGILLKLPGDPYIELLNYEK